MASELTHGQIDNNRNGDLFQLFENC